MQKVKIIHEAYLENTGGNHYKFYRMIALNNDKLVCAYGRIGKSNPAVKIYNNNEWSSIYTQKISKGYAATVDPSPLDRENNIRKAGFILDDNKNDLELDRKVKKVVDNIDMLRQMVKKVLNSYVNSYKSITPSENSYIQESYKIMNEIKNRVIHQKSFSPEDARYLNKVYVELNKLKQGE